MLLAFVFRSTTELAVLRDRAPLYITLADGTIRNNFTVKVWNRSYDEPTYRLVVDGLADATVAVVGAPQERPVIATRADGVASHRVHVTAAQGARLAESTPVTFSLQDEAGRTVASTSTVFLAPKR
jgi:polyferredoxin